MKKTLFILTILALGFTACNKDIEKQEEKPTVYQVCIPATMGSDGTTRAVSFDGTTSNSTFLTTENLSMMGYRKWAGPLRTNENTLSRSSTFLSGYTAPTYIRRNDLLFASR